MLDEHAIGTAEEVHAVSRADLPVGATPRNSPVCVPNGGGSEAHCLRPTQAVLGLLQQLGAISASEGWSRPDQFRTR
jgi:hypothetical protein